jgi:hypothetical protein
VKRTLDGLAIAALLFMLFVELTGGFDVQLWGHRVRAHHPSRVLVILLVLVASRSYFFGREYPRVRAVINGARARFYRPAADPCPSTRLLTWDVMWALLGICAMGALLLHGQLLNMRAVPDFGDPLFSIWRIGWVEHWLEGDPRPFFSANIFYPHRFTLAFSDAHLFISILALPLSAAGLHPVVVYNVLFLSAFVLSGLAMYLLVKYLTASSRAAFIAALLFAFYPFRFEHYSHLELQWVFWLPLALLALHRFLDTSKRRYALAMALAITCQLYSSMYFAVFFFLYAAPFVGMQWWLKRSPWRRLLPGASLASLLVVAAAIPLARPYVDARAERGDREKYETDFFSAQAPDYLTPHFRSAAYGGIRQGQEYQRAERALFPGMMAPLLAGVALLPQFGIATATYGATLLMAFDSSLGTNGMIYPFLYDWLPPVRGIRVPARFSLLVGMTLGVLAGLGCARLFARYPKPVAGTVLFVGLVVAVGFDLRANVALYPAWDAPPAFYQQIAGRPDVVLAEYPMEPIRPGVTPHVPFMYFSRWHWTNMVNGYSGFEPLSYKEFILETRQFPEAAATDALVTKGVTHVTVNCALYPPDGNCQSVLQRTDASPRLRRIASEVWDGQDVVLYALSR